MPPPPPTAVDLGNVQALIHRQYHEQFSVHLLFHLTDLDAGRAFLHYLEPFVTVAALPPDAHPRRLLNLGLTVQGLQALGVPSAVLEKFPLDYREGPTPPAVVERVTGDVGSSAPQHWWSRRFKTQDIHLVVHLYSDAEDEVARFGGEIRAEANRLGLRELTPTRDGEPLFGGHLGGGRVHFGFRDGLSQPPVAWDDQARQPGQLDFRHFLLGYATREVSSSPREPFVGTNADATRAVALAQDGSYSVFRVLYQDVAQFNRFLEREGPRLAPDRPAKDAEELLAAKVVGRWRDGTPIALSPDRPDARLVHRNDFVYADDREGTKCPHSAHVRVVNPRDQELSPHVVNGVPRILRRGTPYGPELAGTADDGQERGLIGIFICASIREQFYILMDWMRQNKFSPVFGSDVRRQDPFANRQVPDASAAFHVPGTAGNAVATLQDFVRTEGTAFFLIPSRKAIRRLAAGELT